MAQLKQTSIDGALTVNNNIYIDNGNAIYSTNTAGENRSMIQLNASNQSVFGYGGYSNGEGASYFDGNEVNIRSKNGIAITSPVAGLTARQYGVNKVLWDGSSLSSGGYYMTEGHKVTLSEAVTAQPNGIVLVWSAYTDGTAQNYGFETNFIPKHYVKAHAGCGMDFPLFRQCFSKAACKYLYINNTSISGHANNDATGTANGITYDNSYFVLRYVIGV